MRSRTVQLGLLVAALLVVGLAIVIVGLVDLRPLENQLQTEVGRERATEQFVRFLDGDDEIATANVETFGEIAEGVHFIRANVSHGRETRLLSLRLTFDFGEPPPDLALRAPGGYPWQPIEYHRGRDGTLVVVDIPDLGFQGRGSVTLEFLLGPLAEPPGSFDVDVELEIQREGAFDLTRHRGEASLTVALAMQATVVTIRVADREEYRVLLTDPEQIEVAREQLRGERDPLIPNGRVIRGETGVSDGWSWRIDPEDFEWAEVTIEVCDGLPSMVEDGTITSERYCPWNAEVIDVQPVNAPLSSRDGG